MHATSFSAMCDKIRKTNKQKKKKQIYLHLKMLPNLQNPLPPPLTVL